MLKQLTLGLIILSFIVGIYFFPQLPDQMASHWNFEGEVDGHMEKTMGTFLLPIVALAIYLLMTFLPKIDPLRMNYLAFQREYNLFISAVTFFMVYIYTVQLAANLGYTINMSVMMMPAMGILFYFIGTVMEKAKQNWFFGIKTPWTLSSEVVWNKTHALGAKVFKAMAIVFIIPIFLPQLYMAAIALIVVAALGLVVYSYLEYKKLK